MIYEHTFIRGIDSLIKIQIYRAKKTEQ